MGTASMTNQKSLIPTIVDEGCCIGCGACASASAGSLTMAVNTDGMYQPISAATSLPVIDDPAAVPAHLDAVCPFSPSSPNEDVLSDELFGSGQRHTALGRYEQSWAGFVSDENFRLAGTSGGITTWVAAEALRLGHVDAVLHVRSDRSEEVGTYSRYTVSNTVDELLEGRGSRYHVQTLEDVLEVVRTTPGRYAVVGVPCFIKAVRLVARNETVINDRITFTVALVCGHLKSANFTKYLGWSAGVAPDQLEDLDYRAKVPGRPANRYAIEVTKVDKTRATLGVEKIPMSDWGIGLFKPSACDYCDDVLGETADVTCGDAWLPPFMSDWKGANVVVARSALALELITGGERDGALTLVPWSPEEVASSQESGLRHRREGLSVRLAQRQIDGKYTPPKRVAPAPELLGTPFGDRMLLREKISQTSHGAFRDALAANDLSVFHRTMTPLVSRYQGSRSVTLFRRAASWILYRLPVPVERLLRKLTGGRRFS